MIKEVKYPGNVFRQNITLRMLTQHTTLHEGWQDLPQELTSISIL